MCSMKMLRIGYCNCSRHFLYVLLTSILTYVMTSHRSETFLLNYFLLSTLTEKVKHSLTFRRTCHQCVLASSWLTIKRNWVSSLSTVLHGRSPGDRHFTPLPNRSAYHVRHRRSLHWPSPFLSSDRFGYSDGAVLNFCPVEFSTDAIARQCCIHLLLPSTDQVLGEKTTIPNGSTTPMYNYRHRSMSSIVDWMIIISMLFSTSI